VSPRNRILLLARALGSGGSERQLVETAKALHRRGWEVHVGCFHDSGIRATELREAGVHIVRLPVTSFLSPISMLRGLFIFGRYVLQHRIDLTHSFDAPTAIFGTIAGKLFARRVVLTSQRSSRGLRTKWEHRLLRATDRVADGVVVNCEAIQRHLIEEEGVRPERIRLCYNGLNTDNFFPSRESARPGNLRERLIVGTVCVLRPEKGLTVLFRGFAIAAQQRAELKLLIVGSGAMREALESLACELGIRDRVIFQPDTHDVALWLNRIDVFVLPSLSEALSNSLMEAMACGAAAVASRVGGNPELVRDGETGLLFESGDAEGLAAQLIRLTDDPAMRHRLAAAATNFVRTRLTLDAAADRMEEIYREFLGLSSPLTPRERQSILQPDR
jgi:glycosyltransferase involved in cell wall biosynthesis